MTPIEFAEIKLGLSLYPWQDEALYFATHGRRSLSLVSANGCGKTAYVTVVLLLWFLYTYPSGRAVVTSGSWEQLQSQLWPNLELYRSKFPRWKWNSKNITTPEGGYIRPFSTIQPGRAEGHHERLPDSPVMLIVDEAKSVPESIFEALSRCTPTYTVFLSSPGVAAGSFYNSFHSARALYHNTHVTAFDCPHVKPEKIRKAQILYGPDYERHPIYRSMILGEFTEGADSMIIPRRLLEEALEHKTPARSGDRFAAVDWAAGGDETVLAERNGNQLRILWRDRERDTVRAAQRVVAECRRRGIEDGDVCGDVCGLGLGIMQAAAHYEDFSFARFSGGDKATDDHYLNTNAQAWYYFRQSLERGEISFPDGLDRETVDQLTNRFLLWNNKGQIQVEKKEDMARRGVHSPDRADALIMAWWHGRHAAYDDEPENAYLPTGDTRFAGRF